MNTALVAAGDHRIIMDAVQDLISRNFPGATAKEVVYRAIALLEAAQGKQVELREPGARSVEVVDVWDW